MAQVGLPIKDEEVISELRDSNPFYSIVVASEIAMRYSVKSPLRGATGPDKPILAIENLNSMLKDIKDNDPVAEEEAVKLFTFYAKRILNEGSELVNEYDDDSYELKTSDLQKFTGIETVFTGEDGPEGFEDDELFEDDEIDNVDNDTEDDDDKDPSEDDLDNIQ